LAEFFRTEADRNLWADRRAEVIGRMRDAIVMLSLPDVRLSDINGWALGVDAPPVDLVVSVNRPRYEAMGTDHAILVQRASPREGFVPGKPTTREVRVDFEPGMHVPSAAGQAALADVVEWTAKRLAIRCLPEAVRPERPARRRFRA
jgi:hypothetical protein